MGIDIMDLYLKEIEGTQILTQEETNLLVERIKNGDIEARNELVEKNLPFVIFIAKRYRNRGLSLPDLIQEGSDGMICAANKFDISKSKGIKFVSYSIWWVKQRILLALSKHSRTINEPAYIAGLRSKINKFKSLYFQKFGWYPTGDEIADYFKLQKAEVDYFLSGEILSLDCMLSNGDPNSHTYYSILPSPLPGPDEDFENREEMSHKRSVVIDMLTSSKISLRNKIIFLERYGFDGADEEPTLESLGQKYGITRERVRQIVENVEKYLLKQIKKRGLHASNNNFY